VSDRPPAAGPCPGLVIRYGYVWRDEAARGREEGKDRPCAVVLAARRDRDDRITVVVAPITHTPPDDPKSAIEIPVGTKRRLGLDDARSWIKTDDLNMFTWPGPDLRPIEPRRGESRFAYGLLPRALIVELIANVRAKVATRSPCIATRPRHGDSAAQADQATRNVTVMLPRTACE